MNHRSSGSRCSDAVFYISSVISSLNLSFTPQKCVSSVIMGLGVFGGGGELISKHCAVSSALCACRRCTTTRFLLFFFLKRNAARTGTRAPVNTHLLLVHVLVVALLHHLPLPALLLQGLLDQLGHLALLPRLLPPDHKPEIGRWSSVNTKDAHSGAEIVLYLVCYVLAKLYMIVLFFFSFPPPDRWGPGECVSYIIHSFSGHSVMY